MNWSFFKLILNKLDVEVYVWTIGLLLLVFSNPDHHHFTVCPIANVGFDWCPGCGLGRSVALIFRGRFLDSFEMHPLGFLALAVLSHRVVSLFNQSLKLIRKEYEQDA
ncbi:MAG: DUF2752 domain-containing protein [Cyclobacteriaceae bacterium]